MLLIWQLHNRKVNNGFPPISRLNPELWDCLLSIIAIINIPCLRGIRLQLWVNRVGLRGLGLYVSAGRRLLREIINSDLNSILLILHINPFNVICRSYEKAVILKDLNPHNQKKSVVIDNKPTLIFFNKNQLNLEMDSRSKLKLIKLD